MTMKQIVKNVGNKVLEKAIRQPIRYLHNHRRQINNGATGFGLGVIVTPFLVAAPNVGNTKNAEQQFLSGNAKTIEVAAPTIKAINAYNPFSEPAALAQVNGDPQVGAVPRQPRLNLLLGDGETMISYNLTKAVLEKNGLKSGVFTPGMYQTKAFSNICEGYTYKNDSGKIVTEAATVYVTAGPEMFILTYIGKSDATGNGATTLIFNAKDYGRLEMTGVEKKMFGKENPFPYAINITKYGAIFYTDLSGGALGQFFNNTESVLFAMQPDNEINMKNLALVVKDKNEGNVMEINQTNIAVKKDSNAVADMNTVAPDTNSGVKNKSGYTMTISSSLVSRDVTSTSTYVNTQFTRNGWEITPITLATGTKATKENSLMALSPTEMDGGAIAGTLKVGVSVWVMSIKADYMNVKAPKYNSKTGTTAGGLSSAIPRFLIPMNVLPELSLADSTGRWAPPVNGVRFFLVGGSRGQTEGGKGTVVFGYPGVYSTNGSMISLSKMGVTQAWMTKKQVRDTIRNTGDDQTNHYLYVNTTHPLFTIDATGRAAGVYESKENGKMSINYYITGQTAKPGQDNPVLSFSLTKEVDKLGSIKIEPVANGNDVYTTKAGSTNPDLQISERNIPTRIRYDKRHNASFGTVTTQTTGGKQQYRNPRTEKTVQPTDKKATTPKAKVTKPKTTVIKTVPKKAVTPGSKH